MGRWRSIGAATATLLVASGVAQKTPVEPPRPPLPDPAALSCQAAILIDEASGQVLFEKRADERMFPASTTKILTALLLIEHCRLDETVTAPEDIEKVGEASLHLKPGERLALDHLLAGIMLRSGNDASAAGATHAAGSVEKFAEMMNERARRLGCTGSQFKNPHGLHDPEHYTTARDLALIAREAMRYPEFREIVRSRKAVIDREPGQTDKLIVSRNKYLADDPTADGIKTGFTRPAGMCFVGSASRNGFRLISVVMKSDAWRSDTQDLIDWGFKTFSPTRLVSAGEPLAQTIKLANGEEITPVPVRSFRAMVTAGETPEPEIAIIPSAGLRLPIAPGQQVGHIEVKHADRVEKIPVVSRFAVGATPQKQARMPFALGAVAFLAFWAGLRSRRNRFFERTLGGRR
ncbi:MAG: D-alanyl-D-alanine carboxypeptidase [Methanoregulaceae archaeon]|nr:D-alanyl-D-alanine carboxypeptidase [Methanoregulaceae archaeon]